MATMMTAKSATATRGISRSRVLCVAGGAVAGVAVWAIAVPILGAHLTIRFGSSPIQTVGVGLVVAASVIGGALGWGLLALMERRTARAHTVWTAAAVIVLLASLSLPLVAATTVSSKVAFVLMHLAVGTVVILGLRRS